MKLAIDRKGVLGAALDTLYEEFGDDLPAVLRLCINLGRKLEARVTGEDLKNVKKATKDDVKEVLLQSKLGTEYAAQGLLKIESLADAIQESLQQPDRVPGAVVAAEIEAAKALLKAGSAEVALDRLEQLKASAWDHLSEWYRFRIEVNIGAVKDYQGELKVAARHYLDAYQWAPNDEKARCYQAAAYNYLGQQAKAFEHIASVRKDHPDSAFAAQIHALPVSNQQPAREDSALRLWRLHPSRTKRLHGRCSSQGAARRSGD